MEEINEVFFFNYNIMLIKQNKPSGDLSDIKKEEDNEILIDQVIFRKKRKANVEVIELGSSEDEKPSVSEISLKKNFRGLNELQTGVFFLMICNRNFLV